jgi:hypothetical protein
MCLVNTVHFLGTTTSTLDVGASRYPVIQIFLTTWSLPELRPYISTYTPLLELILDRLCRTDWETG